MDLLCIARPSRLADRMTCSSSWSYIGCIHIRRFESDARAVTTKAQPVRVVRGEVVLFDGALGSQHVRVWLERRGGGIALLSHDIGPALERGLGTDDLETFLEIRAAHVDTLCSLLGDPAGDPIQLLADRYRGDSATTSHLRELLAEHAIPHRFFV